METQKVQQGTWTLTAPDGRTWTGKSPINCASKEVHDRIPPEIRNKRILDMLKTPLVLPSPHSLLHSPPSRQHLIEALEIIAGRRKCVDTLMGNKDVAIWALNIEEEI